MRKPNLPLFLSLGLLIVLAGCAQAPSAPQAVEAYLNALVAKDRQRFITLICPDFEAQALVEFDSFGAVEAKLADVSCIEAGSEGGAAQVTCVGGIEVTYQGENTTVLDLEANIYRVVSQDGEWKVCGYN